MDLQELCRGVERTKLLYFYDSYMKEFDATVLKSVKEQGKSWYIVLDQTAFHPKGGGQPTDTGRMMFEDGSAYIKKAMFEGGIVIHYVKLEEKPPQIGERVKCFVDWDQRYKYMRRHTAAHLFDHCINEATSRIFRTLGSWLGDPTPYVDYGGDPPLQQELSEAEEFANKYIRQGLGVSVEFVDKAQLQSLSDAPNLERLPESEAYRVVRIDGFERIPCGGTHVRSTIELGGLKVLASTKIEGGFRVFFDVGEKLH